MPTRSMPAESGGAAGLHPASTITPTAARLLARFIYSLKKRLPHLRRLPIRAFRAAGRHVAHRGLGRGEAPKTSPRREVVHRGRLPPSAAGVPRRAAAPSCRAELPRLAADGAPVLATQMPFIRGYS